MTIALFAKYANKGRGKARRGTRTVKIPVTTGSKSPVLGNYTQSVVFWSGTKAFLLIKCRLPL